MRTETLHGGQFTLSTQLIKPNYLCAIVDCALVITRYKSLAQILKDQFRDIKIQPKTTDLSKRLRGITLCPFHENPDNVESATFASRIQKFPRPHVVGFLRSYYNRSFIQKKKLRIQNFRIRVDEPKSLVLSSTVVGWIGLLIWTISQTHAR